MKNWQDEKQIQQMLDGELDATAFDDLASRMVKDDEFRALYLSYSRADHLLIEHHESSLPAAGDLVAAPRKISRFFGFAAAVFALAMVVWQLLQRGEQTYAPPLPELARLTFGPESFGTVRHEDGRIGGESLRKGSTIDLERGAMEIKFASGVLGFVEAPASLQTLGGNALRLTSGRAWFQVPEGAEGFICQTSELLVEDLGTEFGVIAELGRPQEVHVLKGKVKLRPTSALDKFSELVTGESLCWLGDHFEPSHESARFAHKFAEPIVVFADDFSDPSGTALHAKEPDVGGSAWQVELGQLFVHGGKLDTRGELRSKAFVSLGVPRLDQHSHVLLMTIEAEGPGDEGWAGVSLYTGDEERIFVGDPNGPIGDWALHPAGDVAQNACPLLAGKSVVTLRYNYRSGLAELFEGYNTTGKALASQWIAPELSFDRLRIANGSRNDALLDAGMALPNDGGSRSERIRSQIAIQNIEVRILSVNNSLRYCQSN